ncbi:hypothetical protein JQK88_10415 [Mesorhizobium caraganae]|uniref:hypothetical protein n=1 Tax=Mesorhizobium caraganae TaxID=483206 RepID=UPI00193A56CD|nr:hypothetical protein [Mesorhizobium caraganae]MBM2711659.1 hypothetical protein [Mesorhizobium caraganae]
MLGVDGHQWPEADCHLVAVDARDRADQFHMLADDSLRSRIDNGMREVIRGDRHADAILCDAPAHNCRDGDLIANFEITPSHADNSGAAGADVKMSGA